MWHRQYPDQGKLQSQRPQVCQQNILKESLQHFTIKQVLHGWGFICFFVVVLLCFVFAVTLCQVNFPSPVSKTPKSSCSLLQSQYSRDKWWVERKVCFIQEGGGIMFKDHLRSSRPSRRVFKGRKREGEFQGREGNLFLRSQIKLFHIRLLGISSWPQLP